MPSNAVQQILTAFEIGLFLTGLWLVARLAFNAPFRNRWCRTNHLTVWPVAPAEFAMYLLLFFAGGFMLQATLRLWLGEFIQDAGDRAGLEIMIYGAGLDGGALLGLLLFPLLRRTWHADYGEAAPPVAEPGPPVPWTKTFLYAGAMVAIALPLVAGLFAAWTFLLRKLGLPEEVQDAVAVFANTKSPFVIAGMFIVACVLAPMMEEFLFRAGLYRFCRQRLGRGAALAISGVLFGAIHANWASFLPLAFLGVMLALVYEATGSIRVAIVAHAFFNLNSILLILSGFTQ